MEDLDNLKATELTLGLPGTDAPEKPSLASTTGATKRTNEECFSPAAKKQVVGWPPVRSYRMNSIRVRKMEAEDSTGIYVKVGMDGAPYLRKVDLRVYNSYKELMEALNYMFKCFSLGWAEGHEESGYAITYEDKDGDWMLVGDVPWEPWRFVEVEIITGEDPGQVSFTRSPREVEARRFVTQWGKGYNPTEDATPKPENIETAGEGEGGGGHAMQQLQHHQRSTGGPNAAGPAPGPLRRRCEGTAMGAITLDLRPGFGIGPFNLGMPLHEAFAQVEHQPNLYDVVHVKYLDEEPLKLDIVISFPDHGFHLRFDPWSQRLRLIEVYDVKRLQMRYANSLIGGPSTLATFVAVYALFGPTYPGTYDQDRGIYTLFYPGLSFAFPIPSQYTYCCQNGEVSAELPLEFPDGTTPVACRVSVYDGSSDSKVGVGSLLDKASVPPLPAGSLYMEEVHAKLGEELWFTVGGQHIPFGASPQDVWTELGRPCGIHQKQVDQMVIHSASDPRPRTTLCGDYFYNYFSRGLDILFDGQTHKIKKFVLHTNFPGHSDFNTYMKCNFVIYDSDDEGTFQPGNTSKNCITPSTKWEQVKEILGDGGRAAIQTQGSMTNPFGSTFVYGYQNVAFEVMKNGYIATVTLFQS
ncbi:Dihydrouridine synthase (Dus) [Musa troglodytarum]|uniref:Auxin-responsive protein n=1 Tax=Musa troglodytarum TaxID=320322 RepID=A0A9E7KQS5_9LILI|nr:Dihydrouridine synthase (Dus) [Musa troglodytarum]